MQFFIKTFIGANLIVAFSSWSDIEAFVKGTATCFYCGNFGFVGKPNSKDGNQLLPKRFVEFFYKMGGETEIRGEQAGGGLVLGRNKDNQIVFVGKKIVNQKRSNLTKSLEAAFAPARHKAKIAGVKPANSIIGAWHYRFGTSCPPSVLETHWHEWMPARFTSVWQIENGQWVCQRKNVNHRITHNGDFDAWKIFNKQIENTELGWWLERVLHTPNATTGDSPKIAGMMDLLITQGMWYASVRLAYQLAIATSITEAFGGKTPAKDAPNTAPSEIDLSRWADIFDQIFSFYTLLLPEASAIFTSEYLQRFENDACHAIAKDSTVGQCPQPQIITFVKTTIQAFLFNDLSCATQTFMSGARGSFSLVTISTLEPERLVLSAKGQPISIGSDRLQEYTIYASEPAAVDAILLGLPETYRLDLDQKTGEIAVVSAAEIKLYSMAQERELLPKKLEQRWIPMQGNSYIQSTKANARDPVERDLKEIPQVLKTIEESWLNPSSLNCQSARYFANIFIDKAKYFEAKQIKMLQAGLQTQVGASPSVDLLIIGVENSLWLGERFAQDLNTIFPFLQVSTISANQVLQKLKHDFSSLRLGKRSLVLAITQSGQTFPTVQAINAFEQLSRQQIIGELFILTGELSSFMGSPVARSGSVFGRKIFTNCSGRRTAEPATVTTVATHQTLTEILLYLAKQLRRTFTKSSPFGMTLTEADLLDLEIAKDEFIYKSAMTICGATITGAAIPSTTYQKAIASEKKWALHITETPLVWGIHALYVLITVGWVIPFGHTIPILKTILHLIFWATNLSPVGLLTLVNPVVTLADIAIYIFGPWLWTLGLRCIQGRQLLARTGKRTLVIGDVP
jgi:hypothetical protein